MPKSNHYRTDVAPLARPSRSSPVECDPLIAPDEPESALETFEPRLRGHKSGPKGKAGKAAAPSRRPAPDEGRKYINWPVVFWIAVMHLGALVAPFFFSWQAVVLVFALHWLTGGIGICLGFHRLITHGSFQTWRPVKW